MLINEFFDYFFFFVDAFKQWQTHTRPFVDRMASAWLIQKLIDPNAKFIFSNTIDTSNSTIITYDMNDATFTHIEDLCTFITIF